MQSSVGGIRVLIWVYFWLLLGEGALRKWIFPSLSGPLLIVRDPVLLAIYALALAKGVFPLNRLVRTTIILGVVSALASLCVFDHVGVILYGFRTNFLHLPLIFLIPKVFHREDVNRIGRCLLLVAMPMTFLVVLQFISPAGARINASAGGDLNGQLYAGGSHIRPAGVFSFVNGMVAFLSVVAAFLLGGFFEKRSMPTWLRTATLPCLILSLAVSGSRAALASVTITAASVLIVCLRDLARFRLVLAPAALAYLAFLALSHVPVVQEGLEVQQERFEAGGGVQEGIVARYLGTFGLSIEVAGRVPLLGMGLGLGTNAGAALLTGSRTFLIAESEWPRVIAESGPILGYAYLLLRLWIFWFLLRQAWKALKQGQSLPLFLVAAAGVDLVSGQFGQPTTLGFAVFTAGISLASIGPTGSASAPLIESSVKRRIRGRSRVAEAILAAGA
jgi:hypothetical protein